ncbi:zinc finger protein ZFP2-like isoform X2 [Ostrinia nubilalis]|uniref:zinc finger protein ZFP2-like isoform X2 n=1 Tax=Ostrinia nubilalis TaxID=29057 RepID=UPI003082533A
MAEDDTETNLNMNGTDDNTKVMVPGEIMNEISQSNNNLITNDLDLKLETDAEVMEPSIIVNKNSHDSSDKSFNVNNNNIEVNKLSNNNNEKSPDTLVSSTTKDEDQNTTISEVNITKALDPQNNSNSDNSSSSNTKVEVSLEVRRSPENCDKKNNISIVKLEHMMSIKVLLKRTKYYGCDKCNLVFFRPKDVKLHAVKHIQPTKSVDDDDDVDDRFVKRFSCDVCGRRFVQLSTLQAHAALHEPFPHACPCGVGFYRAHDLRAHRNLLHLDQIQQTLAALTEREQRAFKHEIWQPNVLYTVKKEPEIKAEPVKKAKKARRRTGSMTATYRCKEENLIIANDDKTFSCPTCRKVYKTKRNVVVHLASHAPVKPYACKLCGQRFTQTSGLSTHMKIHSGVKEFRCSYCGKEFLSLHNMRNHERIHTGVKPFKCSFCPKAFSDPSALKRHERTHTGVKPYECSFCGMKFSDASGLIVHRKRHSGTKDVKCPHCPKYFWNKNALNVHLTVHRNEKNFECRICSKRFSRKCYLKLHLGIHEDKKFECDYCGHLSGNKHNLATHIQIKHMHIFRTERFECDYCGFRCRVKHNLVKHIQNMHMCMFPDKVKHYTVGNEGVHMCSYCDGKFKKNVLLKRHYMQVHSNVTRYECDECGKRFYLKSSLRYHIFSQHSTLLYCHTCRKSFISESCLKKHKAKKNCVSEFKCEICDKILTSKSGFVSHLNVHTEKLNFHCDICPSKFKTRSLMLRHLKFSHKYIYQTKSKRSK